MLMNILVDFLVLASGAIAGYASYKYLALKKLAQETAILNMEVAKENERLSGVAKGYVMMLTVASERYKEATGQNLLADIRPSLPPNIN